MNYKLNSLDIECAVAEYFNPRVNLIVPNISWGFLFYEVDMLIVTPANYCYEVEIKVIKSDLIADQKKTHEHRSKKIRRLYFAIPNYMQECICHIPERAGVLLISSPENNFKCKCVRDPANNLEARSITFEERYNIARLGTMRIWGLKEAIRYKKLQEYYENKRA